MAQPIATVNGKAVYSDKQLGRIVNTRIEFTDGSWCDVSTGEVVNNGKGYINIGVPSTANDERTTFGPKTYPATTLDVQDVEADVNIQPCDGARMMVTIAGSESAVGNVKCSMNGDTLVIQSKRDGAHIRGANIVVSGHGAVAIGRGSVSVGAGGVHIRGHHCGTINTGGGAFVGGSINVNRGSFVGRNVIVVSGGDSGSNTKITVGVPKGSTVKVAGVQGNVQVGDTDGSFVGNLLGDTDMSVGKVRDAQLSLQGSGDIRVKEVNGNLTINIQGSGDVNVSGGAVPMLNVSVMGSGDATFGGTATDANLLVMGSGDIDVRNVKNRPNRSQTGSGDINVGN